MLEVQLIPYLLARSPNDINCVSRRWLRILGIDARLETLEEEKERTTGGNM